MSEPKLRPPRNRAHRLFFAAAEFTGSAILAMCAAKKKCRSLARLGMTVSGLEYRFFFTQGGTFASQGPLASLTSQKAQRSKNERGHAQRRRRKVKSWRLAYSAILRYQKRQNADSSLGCWPHPLGMTILGWSGGTVSAQTNVRVSRGRGILWCGGCASGLR